MVGVTLSEKEGKLDIIYIGGYGRSGSTIVDLVIGNSRSVLSVGELAHVFEAWAGVQKDCSCGRPVCKCDFWREVREKFEVLSGERGNLDARAMFENQLSIESQKGFISVLLGVKSKREQEAYRKRQSALFHALREVGSGSLVLDSSKSARLCAGRAYTLYRLAGLSVKVIHLVRDGRAVIWSVMKGSNRKLEHREQDARLSFPLWRAIYGWLTANLAVFLQSSLMPKGAVLRVLYEDLTRNPERELTRIGRFLDIDLSEVIAGIKSRKLLTARHNLSGNRLRHEGVMAITEDREWEGRLPGWMRVIYWVFCWPVHFIVYK